MSRIVLTEQASSPSAPASGKVELYFKSNGRWYYKGDDGVEYEFATTGSSLSGSVIQSVRATNNTRDTYATVIPADDTIPQITEGTQVLSATITPTDANSLLRVRVILFCSALADGAAMAAALFRDSTTNAINAVLANATGAAALQQMHMDHEEAAGSTSATTFKVRFGPNTSGTAYLNGNSSRFMGGVVQSSLVVEEIKA